MQNCLHKVFVADSVTAVVVLMLQHRYEVEKNPRIGYAINGDHRIYSSVELRNGKHRLREGVPPNSLAYIELSTISKSFAQLKAIIDEHLTIITSEPAV